MYNILRTSMIPICVLDILLSGGEEYDGVGALICHGAGVPLAYPAFFPGV